MAQSVVASEAKLKVTLDTSEAEKSLERLEREGGRPSGEGATVDGGGRTGVPGPDMPIPGQRMARPRSSPDSPFNLRQRGRELWGKTTSAWRTVSGGHLYEETLRMARSIGTPSPGGIPIPIGPAASLAETSRRHGPAATAAVTQALEEMGVDPDLLASAMEIAHKNAELLNSLRVRMNAIGPAIDSMKAMAVAKARLEGKLTPSDVADMADFGLRMYEVERLFSEVNTRREVMMNERIAGAVGSLMGQLMRGGVGR